MISDKQSCLEPMNILINEQEKDKSNAADRTEYLIEHTRAPDGP